MTALKLALMFGVTALAPLQTALAAGNAQSGQMIFATSCAICHKVGPDAANALGPVLNGVVGRKAGRPAIPVADHDGRPPYGVKIVPCPLWSTHAQTAFAAVL